MELCRFQLCQWEKTDHYTIDMTRLAIDNDTDYEHVIIIGGGDLPIAAHILEKYPKVKKLTVCDIDGKVWEVVSKFFSIGDIVNKAVEEGRLEIVVEGGAPYMERLLEQGKAGTIGGVVIDCTDYALDPESIAAELFTVKFYSTIHKLLKEGGRFSQQITKPWYKDDFSQKASEGGFKNVDVYMSITPEYGGELPLAHCKK